MTIEALIFDFDGLILDTERPAFESWCTIYRLYGHELDLALWQANVGTVDLVDMVEHLEQLVGQPLDRAAILARRQAEKDVLCHELALLPGVRELLSAAQAAGLRLGLASSSGREWIERWLKLHDLMHYFACIRTRDDVALPKPAPELFVSAAACLGVPPERCVALEDSPHGLAAALAAGMRCVVVPTGITADLAFHGAALRLASLADLSLPELLEQLAVAPEGREGASGAA